MATKNIPLSTFADYYGSPKALHDLGFEFKARTEILACLDVLTIWSEKFEHLGKLVSLDHLSNPDDPPDVVARFDSGATLGMEHTSTKPAHQHKAEKMRGKYGGTIPPASGKYASKEELATAMGIYARWTPVAAEREAHETLIYNAMLGKIKKHPPGGVMVLSGDGPDDLVFPAAVWPAFNKIRRVAGADKWTYVFVTRWNHIGFYSAIFGPTVNFEERRPPPPDPKKIKRLFRNADGSPVTDFPWPPELQD